METLYMKATQDRHGTILVQKMTDEVGTIGAVRANAQLFDHRIRR